MEKRRLTNGNGLLCSVCLRG